MDLKSEVLTQTQRFVGHMEVRELGFRARSVLLLQQRCGNLCNSSVAAVVKRKLTPRNHASSHRCILNHHPQAHMPAEYRLWKVVLFYKPASDGRLTLMYRKLPCP